MVIDIFYKLLLRFFINCFPGYVTIRNCWLIKFEMLRLLLIDGPLVLSRILIYLLICQFVFFPHFFHYVFTLVHICLIFLPCFHLSPFLSCFLSFSLILSPFLLFFSYSLLFFTFFPSFSISCLLSLIITAVLSCLISPLLIFFPSISVSFLFFICYIWVTFR